MNIFALYKLKEKNIEIPGSTLAIYLGTSSELIWIAGLCHNEKQAQDYKCRTGNLPLVY